MQLVTPHPKLSALANFKIKRPYTNNVEYATITQEEVTMTKYNIHTFFYDITHGHFKSKLLCKLGLHNYQLHNECEYIPETKEVFDPSLCYKQYEIVMYHKIWHTYEKCYCCGKRITKRHT